MANAVEVEIQPKQPWEGADVSITDSDGDTVLFDVGAANVRLNPAGEKVVSIEFIADDVVFLPNDAFRVETTMACSDPDCGICR